MPNLADSPKRPTRQVRTHRLRKPVVRRDPPPAPTPGSGSATALPPDLALSLAPLLGGAPETKQLLRALTAYRKGDFTVRLPDNWAGVNGRVAEAFNDVVELNQRMARELERLTRTVGKEGKLNERGERGDVGGSWSAAIGCVNQLIGDVVRPVAEEERLHLIREQAARAAAEATERRAAFLSEAGITLASSLDYDTTLSRLVHLSVPFLADWCFVDVREENGRIRRVEAAAADSGLEAVAKRLLQWPPAPDSDAPPARVIRTRESFLVPEMTPETLAALAPDATAQRTLEEQGLRSLMVVPLIARGRALGALSFISAASGRRYDHTDLQLAEELGRRAALAADNAALYKASQEARLAAEKANRAKDEFLATLSHELRTPLTPILGWTVMLRSGNLDPAGILRGLEVIERNVRVQTQLIEDLLDVSRIVTGKLRVEVRPIELVPVIEAGLDAVRPSADAKDIAVVVDLEPRAVRVLGDPDRLQQVVWNLASNAVKFSPRGGRVQVSLRQTDSHVLFLVHDTGKGIPTDFLPHVFERFRQADSTSTRNYGGLGLGLAIVRHLVELHGGTVQAESGGLDQGATFTVRLPLLEATAPAGRERATGKAGTGDGASAVHLGGVRVLLVDDETDSRDFLSMTLRQYGAEVTALGTAEETVSVLQRERPDVLVSDIGMPGEDGYALIRRVRALGADRGGLVPAAALTAYAKGEDTTRALSAGYQVHLPKPVEPTELATAVASLVGRVPMTS